MPVKCSQKIFNLSFPLSSFTDHRFPDDYVVLIPYLPRENEVFLQTFCFQENNRTGMPHSYLHSRISHASNMGSHLPVNCCSQFNMFSFPSFRSPISPISATTAQYQDLSPSSPQNIHVFKTDDVRSAANSSQSSIVLTESNRGG